LDPVTWTSDTVLEARIVSPPLELRGALNRGSGARLSECKGLGAD
jgi:hypothetical protein